MHSQIEVDPKWAWAEFKPQNDQSWNRRLVAHLFRRGAFGGTSQQLDAAVKQSPAEVVDGLIRAEESEQVAQQFSLPFGASMAGGDANSLTTAWLYRLLHTPCPLREKMTLFWHGHFATSAAKVTNTKLMLEQNDHFRKHALGRFSDLVLGVARDPAMLIYLDSTTNRKAHPNENFARELMELFCLGLGSYTERDIQELARCFTGWEIQRDSFRFNKFQHDTAGKSFLGNSGKFGGEDGVRIVLEQAAAPRFVVRKLLRFFVSDEAEFPDVLIEPLAAELREKDLEIAPVLRRILTSNLFFSDHAIGRKVRSPVELTVGFLRSLEATTNIQLVANETADMGQTLFFPPNVKGWDGGRTWINSATLISRANYVRRVLNDKTTRFAGGDLAAVTNQRRANVAVVDWLLELLVAVPIPDGVRQRLEALANEQQEPQKRLKNLLQVLGTLPEFQLA